MGAHRQSNATLLKFLVDHVGHTGEACLPWPFGKVPDGYGMLTFEGKRTGAHRAMCTLAHGPAPSESSLATHSCGLGHEGCVHPKHLRWSDALGNAHDKFEHGTMVFGASQWQAKFTDDDIRAILKDARTPAVIARERGVSKSTIRHIKKRRTWKHVEEIAA